jgi:hypothetical protein
MAAQFAFPTSASACATAHSPVPEATSSLIGRSHGRSHGSRGDVAVRAVVGTAVAGAAAVGIPGAALLAACGAAVAFRVVAPAPIRRLRCPKTRHQRSRPLRVIVFSSCRAMRCSEASPRRHARPKPAVRLRAARRRVARGGGGCEGARCEGARCEGAGCEGLAPGDVTPSDPLHVPPEASPPPSRRT